MVKEQTAVQYWTFALVLQHYASLQCMGEQDGREVRTLANEVSSLDLNCDPAIICHPAWCFTGKVIQQCMCHPLVGRHTGCPVCRHSSVDIKNPTVFSRRVGELSPCVMKKFQIPALTSCVGVATRP